MAKTTALPAALVARWIADKKLTDTGVVPIENLIVNSKFDLFSEELKGLGINIEFNEVLSN